MASIGPQLPPSASKRKRTSDDDDDDDSGGGGQDGSSQRSPPPRPATPPTPARKTVAGPHPDASSSDSSSSDSENDYGPALPSASSRQQAAAIGPSPPSPPREGSQRDAWMLLPPTSSGYSERDSTRVRNRRFASKPAPAAPPPGASSIWTETPEEKLRRLQDSVLGRSDAAQPADATSAGGPSAPRSKADQERDRKMAADIEAKRGQSLYHEHLQKKKTGPGKDDGNDDPSQRPFDRDKDMALGGKIGTAQRKELVSKAANFGGRFQKGSFL